MRLFLCFLFITLVLCGCSKKREPPVLPNKDLEVIILNGWYAPPNSKEELKTLEKRLQEEGRLRKGESVEDKYPHRLKERFSYSETYYCYNKEKEMKPIFSKSLRARLYNQEGQMLTEDFLRWDGPPIPKSQSVISYIPYHKEGYEIRIVKLEGIRKKREVILKELGVAPKSMLIEHSRFPFPDGGYVYDDKSQCHISPGSY